MSESTPVARIKRAHNPKRYIYNYRAHYPALKKDFDERCAYSCQHTLRAGGDKCMEVDHFNPHLPKDVRNRYTNLYLATRHCNGAKSDSWPTKEDVALGIRFLDPCAETDYGVHIFEDPDTFELWGDTPAGRYHIRILELNAPHLVHERKLRHALLKIKNFNGAVTAKGKPGRDDLVTYEGIRMAREELERMIPPITQRKKPVKRATG